MNIEIKTGKYMHSTFKTSQIYENTSSYQPTFRPNIWLYQNVAVSLTVVVCIVSAPRKPSHDCNAGLRGRLLLRGGQNVSV